MIKDRDARLPRLRRDRDYLGSNRAIRPRFKNFILIALISTSTVVIGFEAANQISDRTRVETLKESGGIAMSSGELIQHAKDKKILAYWLGPIAGYKYSIICKNRREIIVTYIPQGVSLNHPDRFNLTIETYSQSLLTESKGFSNATTDKDDFLAPDGSASSIFSERPVMVNFAKPKTTSRVEIQYPPGARIQDMYTDAERLTLISKL